MFFEELHKIRGIGKGEVIGHLLNGAIGVEDVTLGLQHQLGGDHLPRTPSSTFSAQYIQVLRRHIQQFGIFMNFVQPRGLSRQ